MAAEVLQAGEALIAGLTGVRPLPRVTAQVALQVGLPLHSVGAKGAFEAHDVVGVCKEEVKLFTQRLSVPYDSLSTGVVLFQGSHACISATDVILEKVNT